VILLPFSGAWIEGWVIFDLLGYKNFNSDQNLRLSEANHWVHSL
jgi:hypothetical protein